MKHSIVIHASSHHVSAFRFSVNKALDLLLFNFLKRFYLFIFREGGGREKEGVKHQCVVGWLLSAPTGDLARNPGTCPDWELNPQPFGLQADTQSTEPHQPGLDLILKEELSYVDVDISPLVAFLKKHFEGHYKSLDIKYYCWWRIKKISF